MLACEFKVPLATIYDLSPRQIHEVYFHPRDDKGAIKVPEGSNPGVVDPRAKLLQLIAMAPQWKFPPEQVEKLKQRLAELDSGNSAGPN